MAFDVKQLHRDLDATLADKQTGATTPQEQMPERLWIVKIPQFGADRADAPQTRLETCDEMTYGAVEYRPASRVSALAERVERAQSLLISAELAIPDYQVRLRNEIHSFLHDGTKGAKS